MIKLYTKTVCPKCIVAKGMLDSEDVLYESINLDQDSEARQKLSDLGFMGVPIAEHEGKFYVNPNEIQELIQTLK